jgi:hypothetical protein
VAPARWRGLFCDSTQVLRSVGIYADALLTDILIADLLVASIQSGVWRSVVIDVALSANAAAIELPFT